MQCVLSVPKLTANLYFICICIDLWYIRADAVQICGKFWDTQYMSARNASWYNQKLLSTQNLLIMPYANFALHILDWTFSWDISSQCFYFKPANLHWECHIPPPPVYTIILVLTYFHSVIYVPILKLIESQQLCYSRWIWSGY